MKKGYLSQYFEGVAVKELSSVEVDVLVSNQHEFNGIHKFKTILGEPEDSFRYPAKFLYLTDDDDAPVTEDGFMTWYDARRKARIEQGVMRSEYRLYFPSSRVSQCARVGDILIIAKRPDDSLLAIIAEAETTIAQQVLWLFGFADTSHPGFSVREELETEQDRIEFASRFILESIGIEVAVSEDTWLDDMLVKFNGKFPTTREFSAYTRSTLPDVNPRDGYDATLMAWIEREEVLFRVLEKHIIAESISRGFDTERFIALAVLNRRKSRAGYALEHHLEVLFQDSGIRYSRTTCTENKSKPDFIFPGQDEYHDPAFDVSHLTMLGVKFSCKDRWRQALAEADRIEHKHLLTLRGSYQQKSNR